MIDTAEMAELVRAGSSGDIAAPFRCVFIHGHRLVALTDPFGLGHVFYASSERACVVGSSATLVADILDASLDSRALVAYARFGSFLAAETPFKGVKKLLAGSRLLAADGIADVCSHSVMNSVTLTSSNDLSDAMRSVVLAMHRAAPDVELELSGGLDSRIILAAMPPGRRRGLRAMTISDPKFPSPDAEIASRIAARDGLDWSMIDSSGFTRMTSAELLTAAYDTAAAYDHMGNPVDKISLISANANRSVAARLGGQNGELLRGFYHFGQPLDARPRRPMASRLIQSRLAVNDVVDPEIFLPELRRELIQDADRRMEEILLSFDCCWGDALDRFYLAQRMQSWAGNAASQRRLGYTPLYPFFDPTVVSIALGHKAAHRSNSMLAYRLLAALDPELAAIPLDSGVVPATSNRPWALRALSDADLTVRKASGRLFRTLSRHRRATLGSTSLLDRWSQLKMSALLPTDGLARLGILDPGVLESVAQGGRKLNRPTLGFLMNLSSMALRA
jgi:asparagine synthase (glutamine-hydrolysing)